LLSAPTWSAHPAGNRRSCRGRYHTGRQPGDASQ
jgi:hypothetical protein